MVMTAHTQQDSKLVTHATSRLYKSNPNLEIRLVCVEDGVANTVFAKLQHTLNQSIKIRKLLIYQLFAKVVGLIKF